MLGVGIGGVRAQFEHGSNSSISDSNRRNLARTLPFMIPKVGTWLEIFHFQFQASNFALNSSIPNSILEISSNSSIPDSKQWNLARTPPFPITSLELGSNSSIPDSKPRTWLELFHSRFRESEFSSNSPISDSKPRTWLELFHSQFQASN